VHDPRDSRAGSSDERAPDDLVHSVLDNLLDGCQVIGPDYRYLYLNEVVARQARSRREDLVGRTMLEAFPGIDDTEMFSTLRRCMELRSREQMENRFSYPDGSEGWFELSFVPIPEGVAILSTDITERKRAEEAVRHSEVEYRGLVEHAAAGIYKTTREGKILRANPALVKMLGYDSEAELLALDSIADVYAHPERRPEAIERFERGEDVQVELKAKDGRILTALVNGRSQRDGPEGRTVFQGIIQDVTHQVALEDQFRQAQRLEAVGQLAGGVAHDFNNILSVIIVEAQLGLRHLDADHPVRERLAEIKAAGERATDLTRQLLAFARKQVVQPVVMNLNALVADISSMLSRLIAEDIELWIDTEEGLGNVLADKGQMEQVLTNLVVNARDAMTRGGQLTLRTWSTTPGADFLRTRPELTSGPHAVLEVQDTGEGISDEVKPRIFDPLFTTKKAGKGTGLGLATVYGIVKKMEGHIEVETEVDVGTTMRIYLPIVDREESSKGAESEPPPLAGGHETVLVAEDDVRLRRIAVDLLEEHGYTVLSAGDGVDALEQLRTYEGEIHLLLTDIVMPNMGGRELVDRAREPRPGIKVLSMSGYTDGEEGTLQKSFGARGVFHLEKPFTAESLTMAVRRALDGAPPE